ncbi:MAG: hypothetical protein U9R79_00555 [Armatimonadota bacterium]|nr:hypothetical protein [Armatimonadota bacterium]
MRSALRGACVLTLACLVLLLAGCSSGSIRGVQTVGSRYTPRQVSAVLFVKQWGQILSGLVTSQTGTGEPSFGDPVFNDDGSVSMTYTAPDGTEAVVTTFPDGSASVEITYPDGTSQTVHQSAPEFDGVSQTTIDWEVTSSDGLTVSYTSIIDDQGTRFDMSDDAVELEGTSELPSGLRQQFEVLTADGRTTVQSEQSDGSTFSLEVPLVPPDFMWPDFSQASTGTYAINGETVEFSLAEAASAPGRWGSMTADLGDGVSGDFHLGSDFSGSGRLLQDGGLVALPSWTETGDSEVNSVTAGSSHAMPAGAALDYLIHRWQTLSALMAPAPGVSSAARPGVPYQTLACELQ